MSACTTSGGVYDLNMRGKWILFAGITILLAVAAGAISVYRQQRSQRKSLTPTRSAQPPAAPSVSDVSLTGLIQPQRVVNVPTPIDGIVESFGAEIGQDVFEGQIIAHIRNTRLDSAVQGATLELERAQAKVQELEAAIVAARLESSRAAADAARSKSEFDRADKAYQRQQMLYK